MSLDAGQDVRDVAARFAKAVRIARSAASPVDLDPMWDLLYEAAHQPAIAAACGLAALGTADVHVRATACDLLGVVAGVHDESRSAVAGALIRLDVDEACGSVIIAIARAAGRTHDIRTLPLLLRHSDSDDPRLRLAVATSLTSVLREAPVPDGVAALVRLSADADDAVRDWATFGLGWQLPVDGTDIRDALWARTADGYADAREEGIRGLARRHDSRAVPLVGELLATGVVHVFTFDAAAFLADESLLAALSTFDPTDRGVADALIACDPAARAERDDAAWDLFTTVAGRYPELPIALYCDRFELGMYLDIAPVVEASQIGGTTPMAGWLVSALLERAGQDLSVAADLIAADVIEAAGSPGNTSPAGPSWGIGG